MTSTRIRLGLCALGASALVALPAAASAAPAVQSPASVAMDVRLSDAALDRAVHQALSGRVGPAARSFAQSRAALLKARKAAATLTRRARSDRDRLAAATAHRFVAFQQGENLSAYPQMLAVGDPGLQIVVSRAALADTAGRDAAVALISRLIEKGIPQKAVAPLSRAIASLQVARQAQTAALQDVLSQVPVPPEAQEAISRAIARAIDASRGASELIDRLIEQVPPVARPALEAAKQALKLVESLLPGLVGPTPPGATDPSAPPLTLPDPSSRIPDLSGLLPDLSGLLPGLSGLIPDISALIPDLSRLLPGLSLPGLFPRA